jgi:HD superfamily phosphohydrolase YqeK
MNKHVRVFVIATATLALLAAALLAFEAPQVVPAELRAVICLGIVALITQLFGFTLTKGATASISFVPFLASAAISPNWLTAASVVLMTVPVQVARSRGAWKAIFNVSQQCLCVSVAILVYRAFPSGVSLLQATHGFPYLALVGLFSTFFIVNGLCVAGVVSVAERKTFREAFFAVKLSTLPYDLLAWPFITFLAWIYVRHGMAWTFGFALPLIGLRQLYKTNSDLEKANQDLLELMVAAIEARDPYTSGHSRRVSQNAKLIAQMLGLRQSEIKRVEVAALLHDVGKIHEVFAPILQKPGRLTDEEHAIMQTHPVKSEELVSKVSQLRDIVPAVRHHHENWDGTGYPDRIAGEKIPLASRIIMFADTIDAMTSDRPYRKALDESAVRSELVKWRARQFDPSICDTILSSPRYSELFAHPEHHSLPHTQEVPRLRLAVHQ